MSLILQAAIRNNLYQYLCCSEVSPHIILCFWETVKYLFFLTCGFWERKKNQWKQRRPMTLVSGRCTTDGKRSCAKPQDTQHSKIKAKASVELLEAYPPIHCGYACTHANSARLRLQTQGEKSWIRQRCKWNTHSYVEAIDVVVKCVLAQERRPRHRLKKSVAIDCKFTRIAFLMWTAGWNRNGRAQTMFFSSVR